MDSTAIPPEALSGGQQTILYLLAPLMGLLLPFILQGISKLRKLSKVDEGLVTGLLAVGIIKALSLLLAPEMGWTAIIGLASFGGFLSVLAPYGARLTHKHDKGRNWRNNNQAGFGR